jgi:hypothetical protein
MTDAVCSSLTRHLDHLGDPQDADHDSIAVDLAAASARRERLARAGVHIDESPYLHFLRRFAAEPAALPLAASA